MMEQHMIRKYWDELKNASIKLANCEDSQVIKTWIIVKSRGFVPVLKQPPRGEIESMLINLIGIYPYAEIIICELTWNMDLWTQDGYEYIEQAYLY